MNFRPLSLLAGAALLLALANGATDTSAKTGDGATTISAATGGPRRRRVARGFHPERR